MDEDEDERDEAGDEPDAPLPFPMSLCHSCRFLRVNRSKRGSVFLQCTEGSRPKYGPQPVNSCAARRPLDAAPDSAIGAAPDSAIDAANGSR